MVQKWLQTSRTIFARQQSSILSAAAVITLSSLLSAVLGLWRNRLLVGAFFGSPETRLQLDAYWVAFRLPELVFQVLVIGSLSAAFIPVFSKYLKKDRQEAFAMASSVMNIVLLIFAFIGIVIFLGVIPFTRLFTSENFSGEQIVLASQLTRIMLFAQFFFAISNFLSSAIQAEQRFIVPALSPAAYNIGIILGIVFLTPLIGIYGPAIGVVIGALMHFGLQVPLARSLGFKYSFKILWPHEGVMEMLKLMPPRIFAISVNQIELFATVYFATALPAGSLTIMNIATQLMSAPIRIFSVPIGQASLPFLSKNVADGEREAFASTFIHSFHQILYVALPAGMLLLILRVPLVRLAYGAAEFPWSATLLTGKVVAILALSVFASASIHVLTRAYYALHNTKLPLYIGLVSVTVNVIVSYLSVFVFSWGVLGLATGVTLSSLIQMGCLLALLMPILRPLTFKTIAWPPLKMASAAIVMAFGLWIPMHLLDQYVFDTTRVLPLVALTIIVSLLGAGVYLLLTAWLKVEELGEFIQVIKKLGNWQSVLIKSTETIEEPPTQAQDVKPL